MRIDQGNGVSVTLRGVTAFNDEIPAEIVFDIYKVEDDHRRASEMSDRSFCQNLTVGEAKALRRALKVAIKEAESE